MGGHGRAADAPATDIPSCRPKHQQLGQQLPNEPPRGLPARPAARPDYKKLLPDF